jgi:hypothetical protein
MQCKSRVLAADISRNTAQLRQELQHRNHRNTNLDNPNSDGHTRTRPDIRPRRTFTLRTIAGSDTKPAGAILIIILIIPGSTDTSLQPSGRGTSGGCMVAIASASISADSSFRPRRTITMLATTGCGTAMTSSSTTTPTTWDITWLTTYAWGLTSTCCIWEARGCSFIETGGFHVRPFLWPECDYGTITFNAARSSVTSTGVEHTYSPSA